jgi:hypothetical protein
MLQTILKKSTLVAAIGLATLAACRQSTPVEQVERTLGPNDSLFHINEGPFKFSICLPKDMMINHTPQVGMNHNTGELNIQLGEHFHLVFMARSKNIDNVIAGIANDDLFANKVVEHDGKSILYQQVLPTGETYSYQYCGNVNPMGSEYFVQTSPVGEFSMESVRRMQQVVSSIGSL